jgi:putative oxidoreductase
MNARAALDLAGRLMLAAIFVIDGLQQVRFYEGTRGYMESFGVAGALLPLVILLHVGGGLAVAAGFLTRMAAVALAAFVLAAALIFHTNLADVNEFNHFWKNVALAGAFVLLAVNGPGAWSLDRKTPILGRRLHS